MAVIMSWIEARHKSTIAALGLVIVVLASSCLFHDTIPICHWGFGFDHGMHAAAVR